jgi:hypothetical protein
MKTIYYFSCVLIVLLSVNAFGQNRYWVASVPGLWNNTANWSATSGGSGGASVPGVGNVAVFNASATGNCALDMAPTVNGVLLDGYSGTVDLAGFDLITTGINTFTSGIISNSGASASVILNSSGSTTFNGTTFNVPVTGSSGRLFFSGSVFNSAVAVSKSFSATDNGSGGNIFNASVTLTNLTTSSWIFSVTSADIFQGTLTLNVNSTGDISLAKGGAGNQFNENILIHYNGTGGVIFGGSGGTSVLASTKTITIASYGASGCGDLSLGYFTQSGSTPQSIELAGNDIARVTLGPLSTFNGSLTVATPDIYLETCTFIGTIEITKTGSSTSYLHGGNVFQETTIINNQGGDLIFGHYSSDAGDTFEGNVTFTNTGGNRIRIAEQTTGTVFNGSATFNSSASTDINNRIQISQLAGGEATFNNAVFFTSDGNASDIHISYDAGSSTTFNGPVSFTSATTSAGEFFIGNNGTVTFTDNIEFNSTCTDAIYMSYGTGSINFGNGEISVGSGGFSQGQLRIQNFIQSGTSALSLSFTGTASFRIGSSSVFNGDITILAPQVYLGGCTFNGETYIEKNGSDDNTSSGNNIFNGVTTLVNSGSGNLISGSSGSQDIFNNDLIITNSGSALISLADNSSGHVFNGNITVNCTAGLGIYFGNNANASASLASGKIITVGAQGFSSGQLRLKRFTQLGSTPQSLILTGTAVVRTGPASEFNGAVTFTAPRILLDGTTFNAAAVIQKNGASTDDCAGGNVFNGTTTLTTSGSSRWRFAVTSGDTYSGDVTFVRASTGTFDVAYANVNDFQGNITLNSSAGITVGAGGGIIRLSEENMQSISKTLGSASPIFPTLVLAKSSGTVTLNTDVTITGSATFTAGVLNTTATNLLNFADDATVSGANNTSYVDGPVRKTGDDAFTFPVGDQNFYRPIAISAPANAADHFTAQYFKASQSFGNSSTWDPSFVTMSTCEYWILDRTAGTSAVAVTLSWNEDACMPGYITSMPDVRVARFNSGTSNWVDEGNGGTGGAVAEGTIVTASAVNTFSPFTLASINSNNPLPVELGAFWASDLGKAVQLKWITYSEENNESFTIQRSATGFEFISIGTTEGAGTSNAQHTYTFLDGEPAGGISYYRLKQRDYDGKESYSGVIALQRKGEVLPFMAYPSPAGDEIVRFNQKTDVVVLNSLSQIVMVLQDAERINAASLPTGLYIVKSKSGQICRLVKK